jgi:ATP/maltotriose-dependent transcriptional regulator MalT
MGSTVAAGLNVSVLDFLVPLDTKVQPPEIRPEWLDRPALLSRLAGATARLILLSAPPGSGKTVLVSQWCGVPDGRRFAWAALDASDSNPTRLWWKIVSAVGRACPEFDVDPPQVLMPRQGCVLLPAFISRLAVLRPPVVLVLDDYHLVNNPKCHRQVERLLRDLPPSCQLVLMTRVMPPLELARLRAGGEVADIGLADLRFSRSQTGALVSAMAGVTLDGADLNALVESTEGWPAGVYLAALALRGQPSPHSFIDQFTGDHRFIADFLVEEVLNRETPDVRRFLLETSILDRFTPSLCDAVTGRVDSAQLIERLERENAFLIPDDGQREWYRYHNLFGQMLRGQLARTESQSRLVPLLHKRASAWHGEAGSPERAITHALSAGDLDRAAGLIAAHWRDFASQGRIAAVSDWLGSLGEDRVAGVKSMVEDGIIAAELEDDPASRWYAYARGLLGFALYLAGDPDATPVLERALAAGTSWPLNRIAALAVTAIRAADEGDLARAERLAEEAARIVNGSGFSKFPPNSIVLVALGAVHFAQGRLTEARAELEYALRRRQRWVPLTPWLSVEIQLRLARVLLSMGDREAAATIAAEIGNVLTASPDGADALLARLGELNRLLAAKPSAPSGTGPLTERELVILGLLRRSLSVSEMARELYLSPNTVKTHKRAIYRKLGVSSREEAIERVPG